jgi:hypothetical protein
MFSAFEKPLHFYFMHHVSDVVSSSILTDAPNWLKPRHPSTALDQERSRSRTVD